MDNSSPLTEEQIRFFKHNGYLIVDKLVETSILESWRRQVWEHLGVEPEDPEKWPEQYVLEGLAIKPIFGELPHVTAVVHQLGGGHFTGGGGQGLTQWPKSEPEWALPSTGHIDGYGPGGWSGGFMMGATTYLYDVESQGGAFVYWPGSHTTTHDFFREFPEQIDGSFRQREDWEPRQWGMFSDRSEVGPIEWIAAAGSVVFWHCFLCHTGSVNLRKVPRFGFFARWHYDDREQMRYEVPQDLWKYWAV